MAYIGQESEYIEFQKQTLTADGTTTVFTLDQAAGNANGLLVSVGGAVQEPDVAYTVSAFAITFAVAPTNGYTIYIVYLGKELTVSQPADNSIGANAIVNSAVTDVKITSMAASKLSGSLSGVDGSALTGIVTDTSVIEDNIAVLGFKIASNNSLTRYNMVDQVIEEYQDDDGLLTQTNVDRNASAYVNTVTGTEVVGTGGTYSGIWTSTANQGLMYSGSSRYVFSGDMTLEWWQKTSSNNSGVGALWGTTNQVAWTGDAWHVNYDDNYVRLGIGGPGITYTFGIGPTGHDNAWHHYALVRNSGTFRVYRDGVACAYTFANSTTLGNASFPGEIGNRTPGGGTYSFNGLLDNWRLSNSCRYPNGTTFSVPADFANDANTMLLQDFERADFSACYGASATSVAVTSVFGSVTRGTDVVSPSSTTYATNATGTLISTSNTALSAPTTGDLVVLVDDPYTAATINTDIKGYVSRNGGTGWDQVTLVDQGTWGTTNKKILSAHDVSFSNSASGTDMKYKLEWANQSYTAGDAAIAGSAQGDDHSASNHTITESSAAQYSTAQYKFGTHGMSFASQHVSAAASSDFLFTGDFTVEMWLRYDTLPGNYYHFNIGPINDFAFKGYSGMMQFICAGQTILQPSGAFATNTWNHWALVRSGSTCTIYKDGTSLGTGTKAGTIGSSSTGVTLGYGPGAQVPFDGWLDEVRISDIARYTSNFSVATSEFVPDSNTKLLLHGNAGAAVSETPGTGKQTRVHATSLAWA